MLLRLMLLTTALTVTSLMGVTFTMASHPGSQSDILDPLAFCAPTVPDDSDEDEEEEEENEQPVPRNGRYRV